MRPPRRTRLAVWLLLRGYLRSLLRGVLPLGIWLLALAATAWLYLERSANRQFTGVAHQAGVSVSSIETCRIKAVMVSLHDEVEADEPVALLEDSDLQAELQTALAKVEELRASLAAARVEQTMTSADRAGDELQLRRRLELDRDEAVVDRLDQLSQLEADLVHLEGLTIELNRAQTMVADGTGPDMDLDAARTQHAVLTEQIAGRRRVIASQDALIKMCEERLAALPSWAGGVEDDVLAPLREAVRVAECAAEEVRQRRARRVLRAPCTGRVASLLKRAGEAAAEGEIVVTIMPPFSSEIIGYAPEGLLDAVTVGAQVEVRRHTPYEESGRSTISSRGPSLELLPEALRLAYPWLTQGLPVAIPVPEGLQLVPGEFVDIRLVSGG
ncbi:MAG: hypothetical protein AB1486_29515 [Planctomycetota bacterium]